MGRSDNQAMASQQKEEDHRDQCRVRDADGDGDITSSGTTLSTSLARAIGVDHDLAMTMSTSEVKVGNEQTPQPQSADVIIRNSATAGGDSRPNSIAATTTLDISPSSDAHTNSPTAIAPAEDASSITSSADCSKAITSREQDEYHHDQCRVKGAFGDIDIASSHTPSTSLARATGVDHDSAMMMDAIPMNESSKHGVTLPTPKDDTRNMFTATRHITEPAIQLAHSATGIAGSDEQRNVSGVGGRQKR